ncbi:MAG: flagellar biosynthesis repressor FlbT [Rhizobiaceae bacterium]|nr:MAG: flagellar biosynthesis repressor FlbT [Rhizobiaceae bacterium]
MKSGLKISLKANEKIYINGAVVKVDRKVSLELLNETQFLLESHVLQPEDATTPLRQLYFIVQIMLVNPASAGTALSMFRTTLPLLLETFRDKHILSSLKHIDRLVAEGRVYEALKAIRDLYAAENEILNPKPVPVPAVFAMEMRESA